MVLVCGRGSGGLGCVSALHRRKGAPNFHHPLPKLQPQPPPPPLSLSFARCKIRTRTEVTPGATGHTHSILIPLMQVFIKIPTRQGLVTLTVEPSDTVGAVLSQLLRSESMEQQPDGQQRLMLGDALLDNERTLADACIEHEATLDFKFVDPSMQLNRALPLAAASPLDLRPSGVAAAQQHDGQGGSTSAASVVDPAPQPTPHSTEQPLATAVAPPPSPFLMRNIDPTTPHNVRRTQSLQADILCKLVGQGIYEFERMDGEWAFVSPSEYERLKATGEAFVEHDASVDGWCVIATGGAAHFVRLDVDDMGAAVAAHRSLVTLCASSSWAMASVLPALQTLFDDESLSVQAYACSAAGSWCFAAIVAAAADAVPILRCAMRLCDSSTPFVRSNAHACAWALAEDLTSSHPGAAGDILPEFLKASFASDDDDRMAAALNGIAVSITIHQRRSTLIKAGLLQLLLAPLKRRDMRTVFLSALSVCTRMCDRLNSSGDVNPYQKEIVASGVLPLVVAAFDDPADADVQRTASQMLWYLTRDAKDELVAGGIPALKAKLLGSATDTTVLKNILRCIPNYFWHANKAHADVFLQLGALPSIVTLLAHESPEIQEWASFALTKFTNTSETIRKTLCDAGAVGALVGVVQKGSGEARKQACGAAWGLVSDCSFESANSVSARETLLRELLSSDSELVMFHVSCILDAFHLRSAPQWLLDDGVVAVVKRTVLEACSIIDAKSRLFLQNLSLFMLQNFVVDLPLDVFPRIVQFGEKRDGDSHSDCCLLLSNLSTIQCNASTLVSHNSVLSYLLDNFKSVPDSDSRWLNARSDLRWSLTAFVNLSQWPQCRPHLLAAGVGEVMANFLVEGFVMEPMVIIALAFLYGSNEISVGRINCGISTVLASRPAALMKLVDCLDTTLQNKEVAGFAYGAFQINTLLCALEQLALSDSNKAHLAVPRVVALAHRSLFMFTSGAPRLVSNGSVGGGGDDIRSAEAAVSILLQLSFTSDDIDVLEQSMFPPSMGILSCLEAFLQSPKNLTDESRRCSRLLVSRLTRPPAAAAPLQPVIASVAAGSRTRHVMFSYCWAQSAAPEHVRTLASMLKTSHEIETWIDTTGSALVGPMAGSTDEVMAAAVEASSHVVVCVSKDYKVSPNCRQEGSYARQQEKKGKLKIIYVMMQQQYTTVSSPECVDGWLAIMVADKLW